MTKIEDRLLEVDITVIQVPKYVTFECPYCEEEIETSYSDFCSDIGVEICDWNYSKIECPKCGKTIEINSVDWD